MAIAVFGVSVAALLRFHSIEPLVVLVFVVLGWPIVGTVQGTLSLQTIFGFALYATLLSPLYLYGILGGGESVFQRTAPSQ